MSLSEDLRKFIDPEYEEFEGYPTDTDDVAEKWGEAFTTAFTEILTPSSLAGLVFVGGAALITPNLKTGLAVPGAMLPALIDSSLRAAVDQVVIDSSVALAVAPVDETGQPTEFNSAIEVFKGLDPEVLAKAETGEASVGKQIAELAEERLSNWMITGTFVAFPPPPPSGTGLPNTPWGASPPEPDPPPEEDEEDEEQDEEAQDS